MVWSVGASHSSIHHATVSFCYSPQCDLVVLGILGYGISCIILESCRMSGKCYWFRVLRLCCSVVIVWYCSFVISKIRLLMKSVQRELSLLANLWTSRNSFIVSFVSANPGYESPSTFLNCCIVTQDGDGQYTFWSWDWLSASIIPWDESLVWRARS